MSQYQGTFQRVEKKYLLNESQYKCLQVRLEGQIVPDQYGQSTVCNLYFDTPDRRLIRASLRGPAYKEKLRLRSYGVPEASTTVFPELKKKYHGVVYKRRVDLTYKEAAAYLCKGTHPEKSCQILNEMDWFMQFYKGIAPAMFISYERSAFYGIDEPGLRLTFDSRILWREEELRLDRGVWGTPLLDQGQVLLEVKIPGAMPVWLAQQLDALNIFPVSYSKYGTAYKRSLQGGQIKPKEGIKSA